MNTQHRDALRTQLGAEAVRWDDDTLAQHRRDTWCMAVLRDMRGELQAQPLCVVSPASTADVATTLQYANANHLTVVPFGAGSGVCGGVLPSGGEIVIDLRRMNQIITLNEQALWVRVQAGMMGGTFEAALNDAGYSMRHFPQSIDISTVGGWVATRAAGQFSTRYGCIEDVVLAMEAVLPDGTVVQTGYGPRAAAGPDLRHLFLGAEGTHGIVTEVTMRLVPVPEKQVLQSYGFESMHEGLEAIRLIVRQGWRPPVVRLYDAMETARLFPDVSTGSNHALVLVSEGPTALADVEGAACDAICTAGGGTPLGPGPVERWMGERNHVPGFEPFLEKGLVLDTIEVATTWDHIDDLYREVIADLQQVPGIVLASGHSSHSYPQGTNIYFTFAANPDTPENAEATYFACWKATMEATLRCHGTIAHHHGIGRLRAAWMAQELGNGLAAMRRVKHALDPNGIMNPGVLLP